MRAAGEGARTKLSALEFDVLTEHLGWESHPLVLKVPSPGRTHAERAELVQSAWKTLARKKLGRPTGLDPELEWMLRSLVRPAREVDGRTWFGRSIRVLAAAGADSDERAVLATKDGDSISLRSAAATGLAREAASILPAKPPGPGRSVTVRSADLDAAASEAGSDFREFPPALRRRGARAEDAEVLVRMVSEVTARGQFGAAARDRREHRSRAEHVVGFFDSPHGRYVQIRREATPGDPWSTIAPADGRRVTGYIEELLASVVDLDG